MGQNRQDRPRRSRKGDMETVQEVNQEPWGPAQAPLQSILGEAESQYQSGVGTALPDFSAVAPLDAGTMGNIRDIQGAGDDPRYAELYSASQAPSEAAGFYRGVMGGNTRDNPFLQGLLQRAGDQVRANYSATGRYGSRAHNRGTAEGLAPLLYQNYSDAMGREMAAAGALEGTQMGRLGLGGNIMGMLSQNRLNQNQQRLGAGQMLDANQQAQRTADYQRSLWELGGGQNWALDNYLNRVGTIGGMGGQQQIQEPNPGFMAQYGVPLIGAAIGAMSDRRLKTDIKRVGKTDGGLPIYTFRYIGEDMTVMGVMADEVEKVKPEAVGEFNGYKTVKYAEIE